MKPFLKLVFTAIIALSACSAWAQVPEDYQATVKVDDQSPAARDKGLREALSGVLAKVSGQANLAASGRTAAILAKSSALIRSVAYQTDDKNQLMLVAQFEPNAVDTALRQQGLPVHGVMSASLDEVNMSISGIASASDYARAIFTVRSQPGVKNFTVLSASGDSVQLRMRAEGGAARLAGALSVGTMLRRDNSVQDGLAYVLKR